MTLHKHERCTESKQAGRQARRHTTDPLCMLFAEATLAQDIQMFDARNSLPLFCCWACNRPARGASICVMTLTWVHSSVIGERSQE